MSRVYLSRAHVLPCWPESASLETDSLTSMIGRPDASHMLGWSCFCQSSFRSAAKAVDDSATTPPRPTARAARKRRLFLDIPHLISRSNQSRHPPDAEGQSGQDRVADAVSSPQAVWACRFVLSGA